MCKNIAKLVNDARNYALAYAKQYNVTDPDLIEALFVTHLAHLLNQ